MTGEQGTEIRNQIAENRCRIGRFLFLFPGLFFLFGVFFLSFPSTGFPENTVEVRGLRHWAASEYIRLVIDLSGRVDFSKGKLSNPERLFFDLKNARVMKGLQPSFAINDRVLKSVRIGQFNADTVRIVLDLQTADYDYKVFSLEDPARLVIDIFSKGANGGGGNKPETRTEASSVPTPSVIRPEIVQPGMLSKRVVIDAGHGGHDPGAIGPTRLYEKDVVLDVALKARDIIKNEYPGYEVILTRDRDVFIELKDRAKIANDNKADLFVSIHANASPNGKARGMETYLLNWSNDAEAMRVAARENQISIKKMKQMKTDVGFILASLERDLKRNESINLAGYIQNSLVSAITTENPRVLNLGVKQAFFYVLVGANMPSALVEISFISNREEEKLLSDEAYREKIARSVVSGINSYFSAGIQQRMASPDKGYEARNVKYTPDR